MKQLLIVTAVIEAGAGVALAFCPAASLAQLIGGPQQSAACQVLGGIGGAALCALALASWLAHYDVQSRAARGLVGALLLYNFSTAGILGAVGITSQAVGALLWPAVIIHSSLTVWCIACLMRKG